MLLWQAFFGSQLAYIFSIWHLAVFLRYEVFCSTYVGMFDTYGSSEDSTMNISAGQAPWFKQQVCVPCTHWNPLLSSKDNPKQVNFLWLLSSWLLILQWFHFNLWEIPAQCTGHFALLNCKFSYYSLATGLWSRFRSSFKVFPNLKCPRALNWFESLEVDGYGIAVYGWGKTLDCNFIRHRILTRSKRILESMLEPVIGSACISSSECDVFVLKVIILSSPEDWFKDIWASLWCSKLYAGLHWASSTSFKHAICS